MFVFKRIKLCFLYLNKLGILYILMLGKKINTAYTFITNYLIKQFINKKKNQKVQKI